MRCFFGYQVTFLLRLNLFVDYSSTTCVVPLLSQEKANRYVTFGCFLSAQDDTNGIFITLGSSWAPTPTDSMRW